jgi:hypothetical protein
VAACGENQFFDDGFTGSHCGHQRRLSGRPPISQTRPTRHNIRRRYMDWPVADPIGQPLDEVRHIRDDITARLKGLCQEMVIPLA